MVATDILKGLLNIVAEVFLGMLSWEIIYISFLWLTWLSTYRYTDDMELDDAVHTAILTLKEG